MVHGLIQRHGVFADAGASCRTNARRESRRLGRVSSWRAIDASVIIPDPPVERVPVLVAREQSCR